MILQGKINKETCEYHVNKYLKYLNTMGLVSMVLISKNVVN